MEPPGAPQPHTNGGPSAHGGQPSGHHPPAAGPAGPPALQPTPSVGAAVSLNVSPGAGIAAAGSFVAVALVSSARHHERGMEKAATAHGASLERGMVQAAAAHGASLERGLARFRPLWPLPW